jgi:hypothetical protein
MGLSITGNPDKVKAFIIVVVLPVIAIFLIFAQNGSFESAFIMRSVSANLEEHEEGHTDEEDITENRMIIPLGDNYVRQLDSASVENPQESQTSPVTANDLNALSGSTTQSTCGTLKPKSISANGFIGSFSPSKAIDNNLQTTWSNYGVGSWIQLDLGSSMADICSVYIAWYSGTTRQYTYDISVSADGTSFTKVLSNVKSSKTTTALQKNSLPTDTDARFIRITVYGNDVTKYAAITEMVVLGSGLVSGDKGTLDKFGIIKFYNSKPNGQQWHLGDPGLITGGVTLSKPSNYYETTSTQVRLRVGPPSSGYHPDQISTLNQNQLTSKGYMQSPYDWKNVEITGRFKVVSYTDSTTNGAAHLELSARGGTHTSSAPCEGTAYHGNLYVTGRSKFEKELMHTGGYATNNPQKVGAVGPLQGKWFDFKHVIYTLPNGNIKVEQYYRELVNGQWSAWTKIFEHTDTGNWGGGTNNCGGTSYQLIKWGGPLVFFRWDNIDKMHFYKLSIREIVPP